MATFLSLSNELLREMNEVELASGSFSTATGIQKHVKDAINRAYLDIVNEELSSLVSTEPVGVNLRILGIIPS